MVVGGGVQARHILLRRAGLAAAFSQDEATSSTTGTHERRFMSRYPSPWRGGGGGRPLRQANELLVFVAITFGLSWSLWGTLLVVFDGNDLGGLAGPLGAFAPPIAAALLTWRSGAGMRSFWSPILDWRIGRWWIVVFATPGAVLAIGWVVMAALDRPLFPESMPSLVTLPLLILFMVLIGGGQEEPGWRGFALPRLQSMTNALGASVVIGVVWAAWHLPLFAFPGSGQAGLSLWIYFPYVVGISVLHTWVYNSTAGSVLAVMVLHALVNLIGGFIPMGVIPEAELATLIGVWVVAAAVIVVYGPRDLSRGPRITLGPLEADPLRSEEAR